MVHNEPDTLFVGILVQRRQVEIGIWRQEVEDEILVFAVPVFPTDIPPLDEQGIETVGSGKIDVAAHILGVGGMATVGRGLGVVGDTLHLGCNILVVGHAKPHRREIVGVAPAVLVGDHLPPNAHILHGVNPGDILDSARLVKVENQARGEHVGGLLAHLHGAPRRMARRLQTTLVIRGVRREPSTEDKVLVVEVQVHRRVIQHRRLVDVHIESVGRFHLQSGLHAGG